MYFLSSFDLFTNCYVFPQGGALLVIPLGGNIQRQSVIVKRIVIITVLVVSGGFIRRESRGGVEGG